MKTHRSQAGFGIVEVMVALVVLGVGMLGIASLYVTTLRSSSSAVSRMHAVFMVSDLADRIRANRWARATYADGTPAEQDCSDNCSRTEMALNDLFRWDEQVTALFPRNDWDVEYQAATANTPDTYTITLNWIEPQSDELLTYALTIQVQP
jgi:type IV pilus assembly protein PilV